MNQLESFTTVTETPDSNFVVNGAFDDSTEGKSMSLVDRIPMEDEQFEKIREERQREVDRLSLELLSNTRHYKKFIAKNEPETILKRADNMRRLLKYKSRIAAIFIDVLDDYERNSREDETTNDSVELSTNISAELQSMFKECIHKTIQHLEWTEYNHSSDFETILGREKEDFDDDDDMMFSTRTRKPRHRQSTDAADPYSYWGATIRKR